MISVSFCCESSDRPQMIEASSWIASCTIVTNGVTSARPILAGASMLISAPSQHDGSMPCAASWSENALPGSSPALNHMMRMSLDAQMEVTSERSMLIYLFESVSDVMISAVSSVRSRR